MIYVANKLELCRQDKTFESKYSSEKIKLKKISPVERNPVDLYVSFVKDVREKFLKKKNNNSETTDDFESSDISSSSIRIDLPDTMEEFEKKYRVLNSQQQRDVIFKPKSTYFKQPTTDYEITCNTVQSAIHVRLKFTKLGISINLNSFFSRFLKSMILINDKNPRLQESYNLFNKYSVGIFNDALEKMSREYRIIAPTKCNVSLN